MISHKHKFIFVHVPKTAGTAIRFALQGEYDELHKPHHSSLYRIKDALSEKVFKTYFKFGAVRNPWAREVSRYIFLRERADLDKFIQSPIAQACKSSFSSYLSTCAKTNLVQDSLSYDAIKINGKIELDYVMKVEDLQYDFDIVCDKIGLPKRKIPHMNKSEHKHYTEYYDAKTSKIVEEKYAEDIEYFNYKFGD